MEDIPFTERVNRLSGSLDGGLASTEFAAVLQGCEDQIFSGYDENPKGLSNHEVISQIERSGSVGTSLGRSLELPAVVFTGCGTSGRIAI